MSHITDQFSNDQPQIVFIGAGNMAGAIIGGLIKQGVSTDTLQACAPSQQTREKIKSRFGVRTSPDNKDSVADADIVILSVKPQIIKPVCEEIAPKLKPGTLIISIAAGVTCKNISRWLSSKDNAAETISIIRAMPNTPSQIAMGAAGLYANAAARGAHLKQADNILSAVGKTVWVESEKLINAVTAVSGSGPAYFFLIFEAMISEGIAQGLTYEDAKTLTLQTALGAATLAQQRTDNVSILRQQVTSPNGTTEKAINTFESFQLRDIFSKAMQACNERAQELSEI